MLRAGRAGHAAQCRRNGPSSYQRQVASSAVLFPIQKPTHYHDNPRHRAPRYIRRDIHIVSGGVKRLLERQDPQFSPFGMPSSVFFKPPLFHQRQRQILKDLAKSGAKNVLEVGCADAPIVKALITEQRWSQPSSQWEEAFIRQTGIKEHPLLTRDNARPTTYTALDIDEETLPLAIEYIAKKHQEEALHHVQRWEEMEVRFIHGSLLDDHRSITGPVDALVACEVIEHLDEDVLERFPEATLGTYAPRTMIVTTPNYAFNANFTDRQSRQQYHDPTGRTNRIFRHPDHKFEWTPQELLAWCKGVCAHYPYTYSITGIGPGMRKQLDKKHALIEVSDQDARFASQHVVFTRKEDVAAKSRDSPAVAEIATSKDEAAPSTSFVRNGVTGFRFPAKEKLNEPSRKDIIQETRNTILYTGVIIDNPNAEADGIRTYESEVHDVWMDESLRLLCNGRLETWLPTEDLLDTVRNSDITWTVREGKVYLRCVSRDQ